MPNGATSRLGQATHGPNRPGGPRYNGATSRLRQATHGPSRPGGPRYK